MNRSKKFGQSAGFTILELVVVIVVIGILTMIALPRFLNAQNRSHIGAAQSDLAALRQALALYAVEHNGYPPSLASYDEFKKLIVDYEGKPYMTLPSGHTFRWVSYAGDRESTYSFPHGDNYLLIIQALDNDETALIATPDGIRIEP